MTGAHTASVDFDLHGLAGIRLVDATPAEIAAVRRQVGPVEGKFGREPDLIIRFVDRLPLTSTPRYLGLHDAAFTDSAFLVLRGRHKAPVRVAIPFDRLGHEPCEIVCERGLSAVPLLIPIINLVVLANGALPLHASAFIYRGTGVLVTGWAKGGKTEALLTFMLQGAHYVGDEWVYVDPEHSRMYGIPEPIRVWDWHLAELPPYRAKLTRADRIRLRALGWGARRAEHLARLNGNGRWAAVRLVRRALPLIERQRHAHLAPHEAFGPDAVALCGRLDTLFFVVSHASPEIAVVPADPGEIARRMAFSLREERSAFLSYYHKFRFAFPGAHNPLIDNLEAIEQERLERALADKEAYTVYHPYPFSLSALYEVMRAWLP